jgi:regulator of cell morphogenesis and NO signaling
MTITEQTLIADIATDVPSSVRVLQQHGIDFCCGGKRPLAVACEELGLSFEEVTEEIAASANARRNELDWTTAPLRELAAHIISAYHDRLREELPRLETMATRVARVHGPKSGAALDRIESVVHELSADLTAHMRKEEGVLFPAISALEEGRDTTCLLAQATRVMEAEHDRAGELLADLRKTTKGYAPPDWACATARALYQGLADLESEMHVHVHLENNILFPRALALSTRS